MDNFEHCTAHVTYVEQEGLLLKIHAQLSSADLSNVASRIDQISGHLRRARGRPDPADICRGSLAFARLSDNQFHRVQVVGDPEDSRVLVRFIDFGRQERIDLSDLLIVDSPLSDVLTTFRPLAREFYLDGLMLPGRSLTPAELVGLSERLEYKTFACRIRRVSPADGGSELALIELATGTGQHGPNKSSDLFSNSVVELGLGTKVTIDDIASYLRIKTINRAEDLLKMHQATGPERPYNKFSVPPPPVVTGAAPTQPLHTSIAPTSPTQPPQVIRPSTVNERLTRFKKDPQQEAYAPHPAEIKQNSTGPDARTCTTVPKLAVNSTHSAYICHIEDGPYHFYVQLKSSVDNFLPQLRNVISRCPTSPITNQTIIPGTVILAKGGDDVFKRAVIMIVQTETCKVYYIDYGNTEELAFSDIYALPNAAIELSQAMAIQFCLANIKSVNLTDQNKQYFARLVTDKVIKIRVTEKESKVPFQYCEIIADGRNVRDVLAKLNSPMQYSNQYPPRGRESLILVVHVDSPSQFFVHYRSEIAVTTKIQEALAQYCPSQPRVTDLSSINIGSPVGAIYPEDQKWYRALVMGMDSNSVTVFYVDFGNRQEVAANQLCLLCPELVNQWKTQAVECCLIGFEGVSPQLSLAKKMADSTLECCFTLKLQSIASGFRLNVDLIDEHGNSIANMMKNYLNEKQKSSEVQHKPPATPVKKFDDDKISQHSSESGSRRNIYQRPGQRAEKREYPEVRANHYSQHDDRGGSDCRQRQGTRQEWKSGPRIPHMDGGGEELHKIDRPYGKKEWGEKPSRTSNGDWEGKSNSRFDQKQFNNEEYHNQGSDWGSQGRRDKKFDNKFSSHDSQFGDGYRESRERKSGENKYSDRNTRLDDKKSASRGSKFTEKTKFSGGNFNGNANLSSPESSMKSESAEEWTAEIVPSPRRLSVVISEYPRQDMQAGKEYKVLFALMEKTPQHVYIQLEECDPTLDKIRQMIDDDTELTSRTITQKEAVLAMPVLARFKEDGLLYRAAIKSKVASGKVEVLYVDYGNTDVVSISEVFKITPQQMSVPIQAIHVKVTDVPSLPSPVLDACEAHFQSDYLLLKPTRTIIVDLEQVVEGTLARPDGQSVAECLKNDPQCGFGTPQLTKKPEHLQVPNLTRQTPNVEVEPLKPDREVPVPSPSCEDAVAPIVKTPPAVDTLPTTAVFWVERLDLLVGQRLETKILEIWAENCYCIKIKACFDLEVLARSKDSLSCTMKPGDDAIVDVLSISEEALLVNFYDGNGRSLCGGSNVPKICPMPIIQRSGSFIICHKENEAIFLHKEDTTEIIDLLNRLYKQHEGSEVPQMRNLEIGDICAAKSEDDNWYRARIMAINGASYLIYFVDYGNFENVLADNTRLLDSTFFMPELCVKVALPLNYKDSADCFNELGEDPIKCTFIRYNTVNKLWTVDLFNSSGKSYAQLWIEGNKAEDDGSIAVDPKLRAAGWCLRKGDSVPIIITHVESANHFFAHLQDNLVNLDILESKIQNLPPEPVDSDEMFAAKYEDSVWYRAIAAGEKVFYLDHGNTDEALEKRKLPDEFKRPREGFAIELHLCVAPVDGLWTDEANCIFDDFINKEDLNMIVKSLDFKIIVDLKSGDQFLSSILVDGGHAVPADLKQNDKKFIAQDAGNRDEDRVTPAEIDQQPPVVETVPKSTQVAGGPVSEPIKLNVDKDLYKNCTLVHSNGPYDFFVHTDDDQIKIEEMANALFEAGSFPKLEAVKQSDFVVAQFTEDDAYYRAVVTNVEPEIVVHFVDYGNSSPATTFHHLPNDLKHIPQLALRCSLQSPVGGWSVDAIDRFENLTAEAKAFDVEILSRGDPNIVDVVIDGRSINHLLDATAKFETPSQHPKLTSAPAEMDEPSKTSAFESSVDDRTASQTVKESSPAEMKSQNNQKSLKDTGYCYICYIKAGACYIQDEDTNSEVEKIMELLQNIDMSDEKQELKDVKIGDWVVTLYEESLYRATVVRSDPLEVFFVDYGNCSPAKKCFKPPADLISIKPLAVKVNLDFGDGLTLNEDGLVELQNLAEHGANYVLKGDSTIELSIEGAKVADLLKDYLVSSDACSPSPSIKTDTIIQTDAASAIVAEAVAIAPATIRSATTVSEEQAATSSTVTSMPEAVAPTPAAGTAPGVKDAPPSGPPATRAAADTATTNAAIALSMKPNEAQSFEVLVSHVVSPSEFYYQMDTDKVDEVVSRLASAEKDFETFDNCQIDDIVCALFDEDGEWYRAKIVSTEPKVNVFFIDYGNCSEVQKCRKLPEDLVSLAPLCVKASLQQPQIAWTEEEIDKFIEVAYNTTFTCRVSKQDGSLDSKIISLESSSTGDMLTHLRSCTEPIEHSIYLALSDSTANTCEGRAISSSSSFSGRTDFIEPEFLEISCDAHLAVETAVEIAPIKSATNHVLTSEATEPGIIDFYAASNSSDYKSIEEVLPSPDANSEAMEVTSKPAAIGGVQITPISCTTNSCVTVSEATHSNISNASPMTDEMWIKEPKISKTSSSKQAHNGGESPSILSSSPASLAEFSGSSKVKIIQITTPSTSGCPTVKANSPSMVEPESAIVGEPADLDLPESKLVDITSNDVCHIEAKSNSPIDVFHSADVAVPEPEFCSSQLSVKLDSMALHSSPAQIEEQPDECISETASKKWTNVHSPHTDQTQSEVPSIDSAKSAQDAGCLFKPLNLKEAVLSVIDLKEPDQDNANPRDLLPCKDMIVDSEIPNLTPDNILQLTDEHSKQEIVKPSSQIVALTENDGKLSPSRKTGTANPANAKKKIIAKPDVPSVKSIQTPAPVTGPTKKPLLRPVKSLAEIKASAKPRISVGRTLTPLKKSKPAKPALPDPSLKTIVAKEDDKIVPGCVLGNF